MVVALELRCKVRLTGAISYVPDISYWSPASIYLTYVSGRSESESFERHC